MSDEHIYNEPAFPQSCTSEGHEGNAREGMTLRDYFAAFLVARAAGGQGADEAARLAYVYADAMLRERAK